MPGPEKFESAAAYLAQFPLDKREKALEYAIQERRLEIELYWKRATYIITLNAAALTAFFLAAKIDDQKSQTLLMILIGVFGMVVSFVAMGINFGGKFWQQHWERMVELLENDVIGPLYKTATDREKKSSWDTSVPISVTKANLILSCLLFGTWLSITGYKVGATTSWFLATLWVLGAFGAMSLLARLMLAKNESNVPMTFVVRKLEAPQEKVEDSGVAVGDLWTTH